MKKRIKFQGILNFRDLGGYEASYGETSFSILYRSGALYNATPSDLDLLAEIGVKTIIDIRNDDEKRNTPDKTIGDPRFTNILLPTNGDGRISKDRDDMIESYLEILDHKEKARDIYKALLYSEKPAVIHCTVGKDRTGTIIMALLLANGVDFVDVHNDYRSSITYLVGYTGAPVRINPNCPDCVLFPDFEFLPNVWQRFLAKYKTPQDYFRYLGFNEKEIEGLSTLLKAK